MELNHFKDLGLLKKIVRSMLTPERAFSIEFYLLSSFQVEANLWSFEIPMYIIIEPRQGLYSDSINRKFVTI